MSRADCFKGTNITSYRVRNPYVTFTQYTASRNPSRSSDAYTVCMRHSVTSPSWVQIMPCCLFGTMAWSEPTLLCWQWDTSVKMYVRFESKYNIYVHKYSNLIMLSVSGPQFHLGSNALILLVPNFLLNHSSLIYDKYYKNLHRRCNAIPSLGSYSQ